MEKRNRRPRFVTIAAIGVFFMAAGSFLQAGLAIDQWKALTSLPLSASAWYFLLGGILWGAAWLVSAIGLWRLRRWAIFYSLLLLPVHLAVWLADRLLLTRAPAIRSAIGFDLAVQFAFTVMGIFLLLVLQRRQQPSDPPPSSPEG
jgi:hypothetical protein